MNEPSEQAYRLWSWIADECVAPNAQIDDEGAARMINAALAEAWDEGADSTFYDPGSRDRVSRHPNPYRQEQS